MHVEHLATVGRNDLRPAVADVFQLPLLVVPPMPLELDDRRLVVHRETGHVEHLATVQGDDPEKPVANVYSK